MNKIYCSAPWRGITIREDGKVRTCCVGETVLGDLNDSSIVDIINNPVLEEIKSKLERGESHPNCRACINAEKENQYTSLRHHYLNWYPLDDSGFQLKFLDIRWNNKCNLSCQYCGPFFSSRWQELLKISRSSASKSYQEELLDWVLERASHINELMLVGGEPMLMKQNYELLKKIPKTTKISIITNLSYDLENLPCWGDLLTFPPENILWNVSIENTGDQFEYVRQGASWSQIRQNIKILMNHWPSTTSVQMIYSTFSALDLLNTIKTLQSLGINKFTFQHIFNQPEMDVMKLADEIQARCLNEILEIKKWWAELHGPDENLYPLTGLENIQRLLQSPNKPVKVTREQFYRKINWYDSWSDKLKFQQLWPHVTELIEKHQPNGESI